MRLRIPVLVHHEGQDRAQVCYPQPIMQFKELTVDLVRYNAWKAWIQNIKPRKKVKTYGGT